MSEPQRWVAWFSSWQDLTQGYLYDKEHEPRIGLAQAKVFEAVNAMYYDDAKEQIQALQAEVSRLNLEVTNITFSRDQSEKVLNETGLALQKERELNRRLKSALEKLKTVRGEIVRRNIIDEALQPRGE